MGQRRLQRKPTLIMAVGKGRTEQVSVMMGNKVQQEIK